MNKKYVTYLQIEKSNTDFRITESNKELENDILRYGIKKPIFVKQLDNGKYELIDGNRRFNSLVNLIEKKSLFNQLSHTMIPIIIVKE